MIQALSLLLCALGAATMLGCGDEEEERSPAPKTYVLVHGAFQGASSWDSVKPLLEAKGHTVVTVELAGRNADKTPHAEIKLATHADKVKAAINAQSQPVILVGHSFGGITISKVVDELPEKIERLVYLSAYLPRSGDSLAKLAEEDVENGFTEENFVISADYASASVLARDRISIFCADCTTAQQSTLLAHFHDEPLGPMAEPVTLGDKWTKVPKLYIKTSKDNAISPQLQALMLSRVDVDEQATLETSHAPFLVQPDALTAILAP